MQSTYKSLLIQAIERTKQERIEDSDFFIETNSYPIIDKDKGNELLELFYREVYYKDLEEVAGQCIYYTISLKKEIERILGYETLITYGYGDYLNKQMFYTSLDEINNWTEASAPELAKGRYIHCWLTLPSLEVIDITIAATMININPGILGPDFKDWRVFIMGKPDHGEGQANCIVHRPQFVGLNFAYKKGLAGFAIDPLGRDFVKVTDIQ
jgi:hypothetical protein